MTHWAAKNRRGESHYYVWGLKEQVQQMQNALKVGVRVAKIPNQRDARKGPRILRLKFNFKCYTLLVSAKFSNWVSKKPPMTLPFISPLPTEKILQEGS